MTDQSVFNTPQESGQPAQEPVQSPFANQLQGIINEETGKPKYDTVEKALDGLANAQSYIPQLKSDVESKDAEISKLKAELEQRQSVEDVVSRLTASQEPQAAPEPTTPAPASITQEDVAKLVQDQLNANTQAQKSQANQTQVNSALISTYGDKAGEVVSKKAAELGTTPQALEQMAGQNPNLVLALFNTTQPSGVKPTTGSVNIPPVAPTDRPALEKPSKSLLAGATSKEQTEYMKKVRDEVYARHGIVT